MSTKPLVSVIFRRYLESSRCAALEAFSDLTGNGRAPWVEAELARSDEDQARAA